MYNHEAVYTVYNYVIRYETNTIMFKYSNLLSFNIIVHNTIKYQRGNQGYRGAFSKRPLKGKIQWTTTKSKSLTAWGWLIKKDFNSDYGYSCAEK